MRYFQIADKFFVEVYNDGGRVICFARQEDGWMGCNINGFTFFFTSTILISNSISLSCLPEDFKEYMENPFFEIDVQRMKEKFISGGHLL